MCLPGTLTVYEKLFKNTLLFPYNCTYRICRPSALQRKKNEAACLNKFCAKNLINISIGARSLGDPKFYGNGSEFGILHSETT